VPIVNDNIPELNETVLLALSSTNGLAGGITNATLEIISVQDLPVYLLTVSNQLLRFSRSPSVIQTNLAITGLQSKEFIQGIDFRPATAQLFGLGSSNRIYTINVTNGVATQVGSPNVFTLSGNDFGFDFNPVADRIRVTSDTEQNLRLNPNDGTLVGTDVTLAYAAGDIHVGANPAIVGCAYINNFAGSVATTMYDVDADLDILVMQNPPNNGTLNTIGPLGVDVTGVAGFDFTEADKAAYAIFKRASGVASEIYRVNLVTGTATLLGAVNSADIIRDLAIPEPPPVLNIAQAGTNAVISWTAASLGYTLEKTASLNPAAWTAAGLAAPALVADQKSVTDALTTTNRFFRLKK
jgi:hypothetical protein